MRRSWKAGAAPWSLVIEIEPIEANELLSAATSSLAFGGLAAAVLLGVASC